MIQRSSAAGQYRAVTNGSEQTKSKVNCSFRRNVYGSIRYEGVLTWPLPVDPKGTIFLKPGIWYRFPYPCPKIESSQQQ